MAGRNPQKVARKGSLAWMQALVERHPDRLNAAIATSLGVEAGGIEWVSPLREDECAEYRDAAFLDRLRITLDIHPLQAFWPAGGPQWDALARTRTGVLLVEAKAHLRELRSACAAGERSLARIRTSLAAVKRAIGADPNADWTASYYQYANRLAHLYLLRELNGVDAELILLCFLNDREMRGPSLRSQWLEAFGHVHCHLGIRAHPLLDHVHHVFIDVETLTSPAPGIKPCSSLPPAPRFAAQNETTG